IDAGGFHAHGPAGGVAGVDPVAEVGRLIFQPEAVALDDGVFGGEGQRAVSVRLDRRRGVGFASRRGFC
ncbi:MAG: hypothetical protein LBD30_09095, partial [Verrucomicrobiales bacterium]|nr:hypothetical protein [Verrucomicrobiales bacterium]